MRAETVPDKGHVSIQFWHIPVRRFSLFL